MSLPNTILNAFTYPWKASVIVFTVTHALTNRSKVIPGRGPYPVIGWEAVTFFEQLKKEH
jgi:hypothetical protein